MDFHLKQWRNQQYESEQEEQEPQQHSAKIPKLLDHHQQQPHQIKPEPSPVSSALPLFVHMLGLILRCSSDVSNKRESKDLFEPHNEVSGSDGKSGGHILRHFFDDWSRSLQEPENASSMNSSTTGLSISMPGNSSSDVSLKLSTGDGDGPAQQDGHMGRDHHPQLGWATGWGASPMAPMGGPLAEALRSSNSNSSPTSVLHQLPRGSASETCIVSS